MKKLFRLLQEVFFLLFILTFFFTLLEFTGAQGFLRKLNYPAPVYNGKEYFDPSLQRINSVKKLVTYCDSIYNVSTDQQKLGYNIGYTRVVREVVRNRFYHGYSTYSIGNNYLALFGDLAYRPSVNYGAGLSAIVIPDEIMKYPFAACSQQCIILMEALEEKGFSVRPIGFKGNARTGGHFCLEVYYENSWHFFDPDLEPDYAVFASHNYPDTKFLATHTDVMLEAYAKHPPEKMLTLFNNPIYGATNKFPAVKARIFHYVTFFLSYTLWIFFGLAFILIRRKNLALSNKYVRNSRVFIPHLQERESSLHNA